MTNADPTFAGGEPARLVPPAVLTCPRCGGGLPGADAPSCPSCGNSIGPGLFMTAPPPLPERPSVSRDQPPGDDDDPAANPGADPAISSNSAPEAGREAGREATPEPDTTAGPAPAQGPMPATRGSMMVLDGDVSQLRPIPVTPPAPTQDFGTCAECGEAYDADGYCSQCGAGRPAPRDHVTSAPAPWLAGVSDRGLRHAENQDAMALRVDPNHPSRAALVVCDGVTTAMRSAQTSLAAAQAAADVLSSSRAQGLGVASAREAALTARIEAAADAAIDAVREITDMVTAELAETSRQSATEVDASGSLPACTFLAAIIEEDLFVVGSVGDSRAYWMPDDAGPTLLTVDDSFAQEQIRSGRDRAAAESGPHAHAITRWLGADAPDHTPSSNSLAPPGPGWLLLCSDGLWNYASEAVALAAVLRQVTDEVTGGGAGGGIAVEADPLALAQGLIRWAKQQGGHDNITAVVARVGVPVDGPHVAAARPEHEDAVHG